MGQLTLILGGARSGKSTHAQRLAEGRDGQVLYIATARVLDEEMEARVAVHRQERPQHWATRVLFTGIGRALLQDPPHVDVILLDCLTMLVTNLLLDLSPDENRPDEDAAEQALSRELSGLLDAIHIGAASWIIVSNEVGLGLVPPYPLGRVYRDLLGRANQRLAAVADEVYWMAAGIPVPIHSYRL